MQVIIPHTNTDLDALGAAVGVQVLYPRAIIVLPGTPNPLAAEFISLHRYNLRVRIPRDIDLSAVRQAIVVDTADPARLGALQEVVKSAQIHLYDHHPWEPGDLQATLEVRDLVGATCTLVAELIEESGAQLTPVQATAMLLGIYADTGSLTVMGTTARDARAAAFLLEQGANLRAVDRFIQATLSPAQQGLLHQLQSRSRWVNVRGARIRLLEGETPEYIGGMAMVVHRLQEIMPAPALFAAVRMADRVHLVGRSEVPWVDCAKVMGAFGGGGHPTAASAVAKGVPLPTVVDRLEAALTDSVERPVLVRDVMSAPVKAILSSKPARDAERLMLRHGHSGLPVVDAGGRLEGMVSLRDVEKARRHGLDHAPVKGIMIRRVLTATPEEPIDAVQDRMVEKDIGRVPVVERENLVGIISRSDLLGLLYGGAIPRWHRTLYTGPGTLGSIGDGDLSLQLARRAMEAAPPAVQSLLHTAGAVGERMGLSVYAVGGLVRDLLLERSILDTDMVVEGDGLAFARELGAALNCQAVKEVPRFATAHIYMDDSAQSMPGRVDIATARREFYEHAAALPLVEHANLREDLYRRDFSINAMAIRLTSVGTGGLIDFFGGLQDLEKGHVRILHSLSFVEDPTRILRAIRFAHRCNFTLEPETRDCARRALADGFLERVSSERLWHELVLLLTEPLSGGAVHKLRELGAAQRILPSVDWTDAELSRLDRVEELVAAMPDLSANATPWLTKVMLLLQPMALPEAAALIDRWQLRKENESQLLLALTHWERVLAMLRTDGAGPTQTVEELRAWAPSGLLMLCALGGTEGVLRYWREWRHVRLQISGRDLIAMGVKEGPVIGQVLQKVLVERLEGGACDRETQLALALRYAQEED